MIQNGDDRAGKPYANKQQSSGQRGFAEADAGGITRRVETGSLGRVYKPGQDGAYGYARGATKSNEGAEGRLGGGSSMGKPTW
jgi:hypothetical protein